MSAYDVAACLIPFVLGVGWPLLHHQVIDSARCRPGRWVVAVFWIALILVIASLQLAQHYFATLLRGNVIGLPVNVGSDVLFPLTLAILLYLCVVRRPPEFKSVYLVVLAVNTLVAGWSWWAGRPDLSHYSHAHPMARLWAENAPWKILLGGLLTVFDAVLMVLVYRWASYRASYRGARILLPLLAGLWFDAVVYSLIETGLSPDATSTAWGAELLGQLVAKSAAGCVYSALIYLYLKHSTRIFDPAQMMATRDFVRRVTPAMVWFVLEHADSSGRLRDSRPWWGTGRRPAPGPIPVAVQPVPVDETELTAAGGKDGLTGGPGDGTTADRMDATLVPSPDLSTALARLEADWPELMLTHLGRWVAYAPHGRVAADESYRLLTQALKDRNLDANACVIRQVVAPLPAARLGGLTAPSNGCELTGDGGELPDEIRRARDARRRLTEDEPALKAKHAGSWVVYDQNGLLAVSQDYRSIPVEVRERNDVVIAHLLS